MFNLFQAIVSNMSAKGHQTFEFKGGATIIGISVEDDGFIYANSDYRKGGNVAGIGPVEWKIHWISQFKFNLLINSE